MSNVIKQKATAKKKVVPQSRVITIERNGIKAVFDPAKILFIQHEKVDGLLISAGYKDLLQKRGSNIITSVTASRSDEAIQKVTDEVNKLRIEAETDPEKKIELEKKIEEHKKMLEEQRQRSILSNFTQFMSDLHSMLVEKGVRGEIVCHLLTPDGERYSEATVSKMKEQILPYLTREEVENVIASFFSLGGIFKDVFPTYLVGVGKIEPSNTNQ